MNLTTRLRLKQCCPTFLYIGAHLTDGCGGRAPCGDCKNNNNNNNNNKVVLIVILIKITYFIFMTVFPEIFLSSHEIIFICKQESSREGELSEDRFMTPRQ
jgi:hypothetical protein